MSLKEPLSKKFLKFKVKKALKILKQHSNDVKEASFWHNFFALGIKKKFWSEQDTVEYVFQKTKAMKNEKANEEIGKIPLRELLKVLEQEMKDPKFGKSEMAKQLIILLLAGNKKGLWSGCTSLEEFREKLSAMIDSFEKKLPYVV